MWTIDVNTVIVPGPVITRVSGVWRWQPAVTATNYHKIYESGPGEGEHVTAKTAKLKSSMDQWECDEGDIVIIS